MKTRSLRLLVVALSVIGCGGGSSAPVSLAGLWTCPASTPNCVNWTTSAPILGASSGSTSMSLKLEQAGNNIGFSSQPTEGNGLTWNCPAATLDGTKLSFGSCTLTSGHCTSSATPDITVAPKSGSTPETMSWNPYDYTWEGSSCTVGNGVTVSIQGFELTRL